MTDKQKANALYGIACDEFGGNQKEPFFVMVRKLFLYGDYKRMAEIFDYIYQTEGV